jgi:serine/threonine-protein kinase RsbW
VFARRFPEARLTDLRAVLATVAEACDTVAAPVAVRADVRLAVEEAFTNIVVHGYGTATPGPVSIEVAVSRDAVEIRLEDRAAPFHPGDVAEPRLADGWSEREIGGLGWHLIRQVMDEVHHAPNVPTGNILRLVKRLPAGAA